MDQDVTFDHRLAIQADIPALKCVMKASIEVLQQSYLTAEQIEASNDLMGLDTRLIDDGTYFIIECGPEIVGCGGWSRRTTLFGANHTSGRDDALLDPSTDAARVRAMYTHPKWARRGIGRMILTICENAAQLEGFKRYQLMATLSGEPLYKACGYKAVKREDVPTSNGISVPLILMEKSATKYA